ncbi:MAG: cytochrome P450 [Deltaproteobacteria bacterium]|nr:cytochrome P450 [Deltaproteobacteria bacterium]
MKPGDLNLADPDSFASGQPFEYFAVLRREAPVHWNPAPGGGKDHPMAIRRGFFALTRHADIVQVSRDPKLFSARVGSNLLSDLDDHEETHLTAMQSMLINMDPPDHAKYRRFFLRGFTRRMVAKLEPVIRAHAKRVVDGVADKQECDFVTDLANELPLLLICELMGVPENDRHRLYEWSNLLCGFDDPEMFESREAQEAAAAEIYRYSMELVAQKRAQPDETLISNYVHSELRGDTITDFELSSFFILLCVAGTETTRTATAHGMRLLSEHPDQYELLLSDVDRHLPGAIEEILRFSPPVIVVRRTAMEDTRIRGVDIEMGDKLGLYYGAANRDEELFEDPDRFDITRSPNPHLSSGIGEHYCMGASLARMQLRCILAEILTRLPDMRVSSPPRRQRSALLDGIKEMRVQYTPEAS